MRQACGSDSVVLEVAVKRPRNVARHRLFWALCALAAENSDDLPTPEAVCDVVKAMAGHFSVHQVSKAGADPVFVRVLKSISFASMGEEEFAPFFERALTIIEAYIMPGVDLDDLRKEAFIRARLDVEPRDRMGLADADSEV